MTLERSELETVKEILNKFRESRDIAHNILHGGNPCDENVLFYMRQRDWSQDIVNQLELIYEELNDETISDRVMRALNKEKNVNKITGVMNVMDEYRYRVVEEKRRAAEFKKRQEEEAGREKVKRARGNIADEMKALGMKE